MNNNTFCKPFTRTHYSLCSRFCWSESRSCCSQLEETSLGYCNVASLVQVSRLRIAFMLQMEAPQVESWCFWHLSSKKVLCKNLFAWMMVVVKYKTHVLNIFEFFLLLHLDFSTFQPCTATIWKDDKFLSNNKIISTLNHLLTLIWVWYPTI